MNAASDPAGATAPRDPAAYRRPRRGSAAGVAATMAFGIFCVLAGAGAAVMAPRLLARSRPPPPTGAPVAASTPAQPAPASAPGQGPADVARLNARVAALESQETGVRQAAGQALAAAALLQATQTSRPFAAELATLRAAAPDTPELGGLARLADVGAPSRAALAAGFPGYAARAVAASHAPAEGAGLSARALYLLMRIVTVRRVGEVAGDTPDALVARAERRVEEGDIAAALVLLGRLPPAAQAALAPWRAGAERRAAIDGVAATLGARALRTLDAGDHSMAPPLAGAGG